MAPEESPQEESRPPVVTDRLARAWRVYKTDGLTEMVVANECQIEISGVLSFYNLILPVNTSVLVRGFSPRDWHDVQLVDTPYGPAVQLKAARAVR
jgi:hypothetical protein